MIHFNIPILFDYILDYISFVKKIESRIKFKFKIKEPSIFRAYTRKMLPVKGTVEFMSQEVEFFFHGTGITYKMDSYRINYNCLPRGGLGISFHRDEIINFVKKYKKEDFIIDNDLFIDLYNLGIIERTWEGYDVFNLNKNF